MCLPLFSKEHHGQYNGHENHQTPHQLNQWHLQLDLFLIAWVFQKAWVFHVASSLLRSLGGFKGLSTQHTFPLLLMVSTHSIGFTVPFFWRPDLGMAAQTWSHDSSSATMLSHPFWMP